MTSTASRSLVKMVSSGTRTQVPHEQDDMKVWVVRHGEREDEAFWTKASTTKERSGKQKIWKKKAGKR